MFTTPYTYEFESGHIELVLEIDQDSSGFFVWDMKTDLKNDLPGFMDRKLVKRAINQDLNHPTSRTHGLCCNHFNVGRSVSSLRRDYQSNLGVQL